ncbi:MAG: hypothetical protein PVF75_02565 [Granulosicoccaceae bacterium]|jgi:hypothetical protein
MDQPTKPLRSTQRPYRYPNHYTASDFLYGNNGPWPRPAVSHPVGQAPEVLNIPQQEWDDWQTNVKSFYVENLPAFTAEAGWYAMPVNSKLFSIDRDNLTAEIYTADLDDARFTRLVADGVYSKFLCALDTPDETLFRDQLQDASQEYLKVDLSCMRVVRKPGKGEYVAPAIVLLARPKQRTAANEFDYKLIAIALMTQKQKHGPYSKGDDIQVLTPDNGDAWLLAKYFALQGCGHRINLITHTIVHFPSDAINAITKTALPKSNIVQQLLLPHFYLTLPVNDSVLNGDKSLINPNSMYPWSPFTAKGNEIRKLLPFAWYGSDYYLDEDDFWQDRVNAYPAFEFSLEVPDYPSNYGKFLKAYYDPILKFCREVVQCIPPETEAPDWLEIRRWADHVANWLPGFPDAGHMDEDTLAKTLAIIIWNAAISHSADHATFHAMFDDYEPVPFILRTKPPEAGSNSAGKPICNITDTGSARLADQLFFQPHNTTLLIDCGYDFKPNYADEGKKKSVSATLNKSISTFQAGLREVAKKVEAEGINFGILLESNNETERVEKCLGAGIQY